MYNKTTRQNKNKRIAFLIPSLSTGGMERVMSEVANYIAINTQTDCHLILYGKSKEVFYDIQNNVKVHKPSFKFNDSYRQWMTIKTMHFIRSTIKEIKPDIVLSFGEIWNNLVLLSLIGLKISIFVSDRSSPKKSHGFIHNNLRRLLYPRATGVIVQTEKAKELFKTQFVNKNVRVIGNPIREINSKNVIEKENIIVSVGRLINTKHFDRLIDIFNEIGSKEWKLVIIGGDSNKQSNTFLLKNKIKKMGMEERIILTGTLKNVDEYLLRSSIFAFTSSSEGFPNVIGEAMSAGLPVVAYDCIAGPSDMIEDGENGYLIPLFNDKMFVNRLKYLMDNPGIRNQMGVNAKESIKKYSIKNIGDEYYSLLLN